LRGIHIGLVAGALIILEVVPDVQGIRQLNLLSRAMSVWVLMDFYISRHIKNQAEFHSFLPFIDEIVKTFFIKITYT